MDRVIVGVDGSDNSRAALYWALDHARCPVVVIPNASD
jgi:nucleotide-binding universal stress UspA family protein